MATFFVGQRVRVVRLPDKSYRQRRGVEAMGGKIGDEGIVVGTMSRPNAGFHAFGQMDLSVKMDRFSAAGMCPSYCLEPIIPEGMQPVSWSECLWQPEGVSA